MRVKVLIIPQHPELLVVVIKLPSQVPPLLAGVQTFPLAYQSPLVRLSVRITPKLRWNAGWQFYNYHEQFGVLGYYQNFHAHTGYTSVTWAF